MKGLWKLSLALLIPLLVVSCSDEALTTSALDEASLDARIQQPPRAEDQRASPGILTRDIHCAETECSATRSAKSVGLVSPLFGLSAAPNSGVLVADAGAGVAIYRDGIARTEIQLLGVTDISPIGRGSMWASTGAGADPESDTGQGIYRVSKGKSRLVANLFKFEEEYDPDGGAVPDSNPFDVQSLGGRAALVVDAGGNDLLRVDNRGSIEVVAIFPDELVSTDNIKELFGCPNPADICDLPPMIPGQAVPTSVAVGPDGYYYVGELKGFPAPTGASNIWRVSPSASGAICGTSPDCVKVFDGGFTSILDLAFDSEGALLVAELDELSWAAVEFFGPSELGGTISSCDIGTLECSEVATGIPILTAIASSSDGSLWATNNALIPGLADVARIR